VRIVDLDIDELAARLKKEYPGLPAELHDTYVLETAKVSHVIPAGHICQVYVTAASTRILDTTTGSTHTLWEEQPVPAWCRR
jgi:hypothetical protein